MATQTTQDYEAKQIGEVEDLGMVYQSKAPLHNQILAFNKKGVGLVTPEETAMIRIAGLSNDYTRTSIAPVAVKGENPVLYKPSPFMNPAMAIVAVEAHKRGEYPTFNREFYDVVKDIANQELSLEPEDRTAHALSDSGDYDLTPEMDDTRFMLGKPTLRYFKEFGHLKIPLRNLPTDNIPKDKCAINYLWFSWPDLGSVLDCGGLGDPGGAFGVLKKTSEAGSQNFGHSLTNVKDVVREALHQILEEVGLPAIHDIIGDRLEKRVLEELRKQ